MYSLHFLETVACSFCFFAPKLMGSGHTVIPPRFMPLSLSLSLCLSVWGILVFIGYIVSYVLVGLRLGLLQIVTLYRFPISQSQCGIICKGIMRANTLKTTKWNSDDLEHLTFLVLWVSTSPPQLHWRYSSIWLRTRYIWFPTSLEGPWPRYMTLEVCWDGGLWTHSFGLGHGSWLVWIGTL